MRRDSCVGAYGAHAARPAIHTSAGLQMSVIPQRVNTFGAQRSVVYCIIRGCAPNYVLVFVPPGRRSLS